MPRPGGGFGRGFGGGGSRGGGFGGGGFHHGPHRHHHHFGFYHRPFGFFGGGLLSLILAPIIAILFALLFLGIYLYSTITIIANGGQVVYDDDKLETYATSEYKKYFQESEDGILITVLTSEDNSQYCCTAVRGENLNYKVFNMFGSDDTEFVYAITSSISEDYEYSLDFNLAEAMDKMKNSVNSLGLDSSYQDGIYVSSKADSRLVNYTSLTMKDKVVNDSLKSFTDSTGIPTIIVVETAENVFGKTMPLGSIVLILALVALIAVCVVQIVKKTREKKARDNDFKASAGTSSKSDTFDGLDNDTFK